MGPSVVLDGRIVNVQSLTVPTSGTFHFTTLGSTALFSAGEYRSVAPVGEYRFASLIQQAQSTVYFDMPYTGVSQVSIGVLTLSYDLN